MTTIQTPSRRQTASGVVDIDLAEPTTMSALLDPSDTFVRRHIGPGPDEVEDMLAAIGLDSLEALVDAAMPAAIRTARLYGIPAPRGESAALADLRAIAEQNQVYRSCIGMGYTPAITPPVIQRNILEHPGWYTQYTPYQAEIAQGRLEALLNFQTMVADLTGLPLANASLLDEATGAAEALIMCRRIVTDAKLNGFFVSAHCHPQTIAVVTARAQSIGIEIHVGDERTADFAALECFGVLLQYPTTEGAVLDPGPVVDRVHAAGGLAVIAADPLALTLLKPPGEHGCDIAVGSTQRFGVPMGFGGPHAGYIATRAEHVRKLPGRLVGISRDATGRTALRLAVQTREQHIKRDRATSNICTAQVLLAIMAGMYAVYHGPEGLTRIARRVHAFTTALHAGLRRLGHELDQGREDGATAPYFDTLRIRVTSGTAVKVLERTRARRINLRGYDDPAVVGVTFDETTTRDDVRLILEAFGAEAPAEAEALIDLHDVEIPASFARTSTFLTHEVFHRHHAETEMMRYLARLQARDLSLAQSMIPLGSCTMKLNATSEMLPITWPKFAGLHPFAPAAQTAGYRELFRQLEAWLCDLTGFAAVSLQPNAGSQGEFAGLAVIRAYHEDRGEHGRNVCLIPTSAHGTNPASAIAAGYRVVPVRCDERGNIDLADVRAKAEAHADTLGALMVTYPSTHGVFESSIREICAIVHEHGGQVYLDGANMNAMVGLSRPGEIGADVCHLNLHKTFCIPHGGGGPGMGPIAVAPQLAPFLPTHPVVAPESAGARGIGAVSAAPYGSPSILPITWMYIALMGVPGLTRATQVAILNANYMARRLGDHYDVLFTGPGGLCAHEFILDCRAFDKSAGIRIDDIAKRLMDYGFHAPTMAWPVPGTLMIEPTESEAKAELDRLCDALIAIREEIRAIEETRADRADNVLKNAPHTIEMLAADTWTHPYSRETAGFPVPWLRDFKFWPPVARVDNPYGDRHLFCTCPPMEAIEDGET